MLGVEAVVLAVAAGDERDLSPFATSTSWPRPATRRLSHGEHGPASSMTRAGDSSPSTPVSAGASLALRDRRGHRERRHQVVPPRRQRTRRVTPNSVTRALDHDIDTIVSTVAPDGSGLWIL